MQLLVKGYVPLSNKFKISNTSVYQQKSFQTKQKKITKFALMGSYNYPLIFYRQGYKVFEYQINFIFLAKLFLKVLFT